MWHEPLRVTGHLCFQPEPSSSPQATLQAPVAKGEDPTPWLSIFSRRRTPQTVSQDELTQSLLPGNLLIAMRAQTGKMGGRRKKNSISKRVTSALPWFLSTTLFNTAMQTTSNYGNTQSPPGWTKLCHKLKHTRCPKQSIKKGREDFFAHFGYNEIDATLTNEFHPSLTY